MDVQWRESMALGPAVSGSAKVAGDLLGDRYRLGREIARGGMGVVHEAEHTTLGHRVAVKFLSDDATNDTQRAARFLREARAAASLKSPHVAKVIDFGTSNGRPFLVMERLEGEDLHTTLERRGALGVDEAVFLVLQVCEAMAEAHARGIVHRDLKPANVFVTTSSNGQPFVKVLDFGLAKVAEGAVSSRTSSHLVFGTPQYMSPEQLRSSSAVDARADVWSIGVLLHQLVAGEPPFVGPNLSTVIASVLTELPRPLSALRPEVPPELEDLVARCLEKDVDARIGSVAEIVRILQAVPRTGGVEPYRGELVTQPFERTSETPVVFTQPPPSTQLTLRARLAGITLPSRSWAATAMLLVMLGVGASGARARLAFPASDAAPSAEAVAPIAPAAFELPTTERAPLEIEPSALAERLVWTPPKERPIVVRSKPESVLAKPQPKAPCPLTIRKVKLAAR